jgi:hypothetical protein
MAFELPPLPFPKEPGTNNPYIATPDEGGGYTVPSGHYFKKKVGDLHLWVPVSESDPLPTKSMNADVALSALRDSLLGSGNKTLSDLATALEPLATNEKQVELVSALGAIADAAVSDPAVSGTVVSLLKGLLSQLQAGSPVSVTESSLPAGAATDVEIQTLQEKVDALNTKIDAVMDGTTPAKTELTGSNVAYDSTHDAIKTVNARLEEKLEAVRVLLNALAGEDFATQTTLAQILGKMIAAPATEAKQDVIAGHVDGVETLLTALKEKDFATQATLATVLERLQAVEGKIDGITDGTAPAKTELTGSIATTISSPETGIKTVTATAAEVFAGATKKANRRKLSYSQ